MLCHSLQGSQEHHSPFAHASTPLPALLGAVAFDLIEAGRGQRALDLPLSLCERPRTFPLRAPIISHMTTRREASQMPRSQPKAQSPMAPHRTNPHIAMRCTNCRDGAPVQLGFLSSFACPRDLNCPARFPLVNAVASSQSHLYIVYKADFTHSLSPPPLYHHNPQTKRARTRRSRALEYGEQPTYTYAHISTPTPNTKQCNNQAAGRVADPVEAEATTVEAEDKLG